jgi:hypothetical protein
MIQLIKYGVIAAILSGIIYSYNTAIIEHNETKNENTRLTELIIKQKELSESKDAHFEKIRVYNETLLALNKKQQKDIDFLNRKFTQSKNGKTRDIGKLSIKKTKLVNKIINRASDKANKCFELAMGAEIKKGEKNSECQELINSM